MIWTRELIDMLFNIALGNQKYTKEFLKEKSILRDENRKLKDNLEKLECKIKKLMKKSGLNKLVGV